MSRSQRAPSERQSAPPSGVRLVDRSEEAPCSVCLRVARVRRLPHPDGPRYCRSCVDALPADEFDALYRDIGGSG